MRYSKPIPLCGFKERPDAACRARPRCKRCNRALSFGVHELCPECRDIRAIARARFADMAKRQTQSTATGVAALAGGLNAVRVGMLGDLPERAILKPLLDAVPPLARDELREDLKAALRGMKKEARCG